MKKIVFTLFGFQITIDVSKKDLKISSMFSLYIFIVIFFHSLDLNFQFINFGTYPAKNMFQFRRNCRFNPLIDLCILRKSKKSV